ncbi:MAG: hypothetical protein RL693_2364, partial [Verrucomicrobiota bacterium]
MKTKIISVMTGLALALPCLAKDGADRSRSIVANDGEPVVQLAILLDTSGSMEGLIAQAKTQLWKIVNEFIAAKQGGKVPIVQVALYEYGNSGLSQDTQWIRQIQPLTRDLDKISEELFKLRTNGGEEYCGAVIKAAMQQLNWDPSPDTYKAIFIAGNEPFTQGPVDATTSCREAIARGVIVNTIHCGDEATGINQGWRNGAMLTDGSYLVINQNQAVVHVPSPYDADIERLSSELNRTYVTYGAHGKEAAMNQVAQDGNALAAKTAGASVQRAMTKSSANYYNNSWDLVDATRQNDFKLEAVKAEDLPPEMQKMNLEERKAYVAGKTAERAKIQSEIADLGKKRAAFVAGEQKEPGKASTLDTAVSKAIRSQAAKKNIQFEGAAIPNRLIDYTGFLQDASEVGKLRETRRVTEEEFMRMAGDPATVILDARSTEKYELLHVQNAKHLSLPDITEEELAKIIPDKNTRVLIYCNNNFENERKAFPGKCATASLNIYTFNTLFSYGYKNVYELGPLIDIK